MSFSSFPSGRGYARLACVVLATATLAACGAVDRTGRAFWQPYRPAVQQGNWITYQQVAQLRPGMTREQVRYVLGTPTLTPIFHADRWEYPYFFKPGYGEVQERNFAVIFDGDYLVSWEGDPQPNLQPFQQVEDEDPAFSPLPTPEAAAPMPGLPPQAAQPGAHAARHTGEEHHDPSPMIQLQRAQPVTPPTSVPGASSGRGAGSTVPLR